MCHLARTSPAALWSILTSDRDYGSALTQLPKCHLLTESPPPLPAAKII